MKSFLKAGVANTSDPAERSKLAAVPENASSDESSEEENMEDFWDIPEEVNNVVNTLATAVKQDDPQAIADAVNDANAIGYNGALAKHARKSYTRQMSKAIAKGLCSPEQVAHHMDRQDTAEKLLQAERKLLEQKHKQ
jgi:hypothetical protein